MEIGTKAHYSKKFRIGILLSSIIIFSISSLLFGYLIFETDEMLSVVLIQGALTGLIFGLAFPPIMSWVAKRMFEKTPIEIGVNLQEDEVIDAEGPANLFRKMEGVGGKLFLTNQRLVFNSHKLNIQRGSTIIHFSEVESVHPRKTSGIIDNGISIKLKSGEDYKFVINDRDTWLSKIQKRL